MGFFRRIGNALSRFMYGRNGADQLAVAAVWLAILMDLVNMFFKANERLYLVLRILSAVVLFWAVFRMLSRNLQKRRAENLVFLQKVWWPLSGKTKGLKDRDHKYFTCPNCGTLCRVPKGKGTIILTCPKCRLEIKGKS